MKKLAFYLIAISFIFTLNANAITIDVLAPTTTIVGDNIEVQVHVSGLNAFTAPSLGDYDFNLNYAANLFQVSDIIWGDTQLGNQLDLQGNGDLRMSDTSILGTVNLFEVSFDSEDVLNQFQAEGFTLFRVIFSSIAHGKGEFSVVKNAFGDTQGNALQIDTINNIQINSRNATVPEPSGLLIMFGLSAVILSRSKYRN